MSKRVETIEYNSEAVAFSTNQFSFDKGVVVGELLNGQIQASITRRPESTKHHSVSFGDPSSILARKSSSNGFFFTDGIGNSVHIINDATVVLAEYEYSPFGSLLNSAGLEKWQPWQWSGQPFHKASENTIYLFRSYQAASGRWINRDPAGETGGRNLYGFARNNPISFIDLFGLKWKKVDCGFVQYPAELTIGFGFLIRISLNAEGELCNCCDATTGEVDRSIASFEGKGEFSFTGGVGIGLEAQIGMAGDYGGGAFIPLVQGYAQGKFSVDCDGNVWGGVGLGKKQGIGGAFDGGFGPIGWVAEIGGFVEHSIWLTPRTSGLFYEFQTKHSLDVKAGLVIQGITVGYKNVIMEGESSDGPHELFSWR